MERYARALAIPRVGERVADSRVEVEVDFAAGSESIAMPDRDVVEIRYPMAFNDIAEGWSWNPQADRALQDYYIYKYLPLLSVVEERGEYEGEDKIGEIEHRRITWRYDYYLAFANHYDFYPRSTDDAAGFAVQVPAARAGHVAMRAVARLVEPFTRESSTFWKATYRKPVDFTLKKRYLMVELLEIRFVDRESGVTLATLLPSRQR